MDGLQMAHPPPHTPSPGPSVTTPTPTNMNGAPLTNNNAISRRPPRKSTLTQQQKNQKRQRATQDQLITLELEFSKNPTPTAIVRERIAQEINMTERSVQIWFQNRRAKIKTLVKKNIETGEDCDNIPESMRKYLQMQAMEMGKGLGGVPFTRPGGLMAPYGPGAVLLNDSNPGKVVIQHFTCRSLSIGSWRRIGQNAMDLVIFYSPERSTVTYYINNDSAGYKIEYPFSYIKNITLETGDVVANAEGAAHRPGGLVIELNRAPHFFMDHSMDASGSSGFYQCGDFTEDLQASRIKVHHLGGHPKVLSGQLAKLVSLESFQNRHSVVHANNNMAVQTPPAIIDPVPMPLSATHSVIDPNTIAASAPVSPMGTFRPASQPNHLVHPRHVNSFNENQNLMMPPRGHKRQRSRSVPVAVDFNMLRNHPMPSFFIQHEQPPHHPAPMADPNIFAPIPQHQPMHGFAQPSIGPHLSIDTSATYGMDFGRGPPMSATTLNSPSEFGTPAFFHSTGAPSENASTLAPAHTPFSMPHLSPMMDPAAMPAHSPLSAASPAADPVIANSSPPLNSFDHNSAEQDFFSLQHHAQLEDEAVNFGDMYAKQNFTLPFRGPLDGEAAGPYGQMTPPEHASQTPTQGPMHPPPPHHQQQQLAPPMGTIDPASLSPAMSG